MRKDRGFTLVELLTVIGIIAILVSLLIPTFTKVRAMANTAKCASNMQQIGFANLQFATEHENRSAGSGNNGSSVAWQNILSVEHFKVNGFIPRLGSGGKLFCPTAQAFWEGRNSPGYRSYSMNGSLADGSIRPFNANEMKTLNPLYVTVTKGSWTWASYGLGARIDAFKNPQRKLQLVDTDRGNDVFGNSAGLVLMSDPSAPFAWAAGAFSFRHDGMKMNILYMDNHVSTERFDPLLALPKYVSPAY